MTIAKTKKHDDIGKNMYSGVFEVADNEFVIRFLWCTIAAAKTQKHDDIILNYENLLTHSLSAIPSTPEFIFLPILSWFFRFRDRDLEFAILNYEYLITDS